MLAQDLLAAATAFRSAAESVAPLSQQFASLKDFPKGRCKESAMLMAAFLDREHGIQESTYVWGARPTDQPYSGHTHGWLEVAGYIVDVTADQFSEVAEPVLVLPREASPFHAEFLNQSPDAYPRFWEAFRPEVAADFERTLEALIAAVEGS